MAVVYQIQKRLDASHIGPAAVEKSARRSQAVRRAELLEAATWRLKETWNTKDNEAQTQVESKKLHRHDTNQLQQAEQN